MTDFFLGRQPIFDADLNVKAYELLYRSADVASSNVIDGDQATTAVLMNSYMELGLSRIVGGYQAFVNLTRSFILNHEGLPPPSELLVLEILEDIDVDQDLVDAVASLRAQGYIIALDDFIFHEDLRPLVELADIVKIDLRAISREEVIEHVRLLRQYPLKLLAEKVETPDEFDWCKSVGFDLFQGYFLCRPRVLRGRRLASSQVNTMRILAKLQEQDADVNDLEKIVTEDVTMSYRLLRYINSAAFEISKKIESIRHAIVYLGLQDVKQWASMVAMLAMDEKPDELIKTSLVRAKMCELLATRLAVGRKETAFIIGMFSLLDAMMDTPLEELLASLPLSDDITASLLTQTGIYADILRNAVAYDLGEWSNIICPQISGGEMTTFYLEAHEWANATMAMLHKDAASLPTP